LAHQWFGDLVTCSEWPHAWLNEGFATYFEVLFQHHDKGPEEADYELLQNARAYFDEDSRRYRRPIVCRTFVDPEKVVELFDHHFGFENFWQEKLGASSHIENVGSCATLVVEKIILAKSLDQIPGPILKLLATAIISNTLNLSAQITNSRDQNALHAVVKIINLEANWPEKYYRELTIEPLKNPLKTLENDTKLQTIGDKVFAMTQMELWDGKPFLEKNLELIKALLSSQKADSWFFTSPSIGEGKNYLYTLSKETQQLLTKTISADFNQETNIGITKKLWLRKEIVRELKKLSGEIKN
jgi:inorganic pyrophosphatase/manganese-dependent inorganic pyrophosphatase